MTKAIRILLHNAKTHHLEAWLRAAQPHVDVVTCNTHEGVAAVIENQKPDVAYSIRYTGTSDYPRDAFLAPGGPKWIAVGGSGTDHFGSWDTEAVTLTNAAGVAADMMAEYIFGGFLHFSLDIPGLQRDQSAKTWDVGRLVRPLHGKTLLIVGLGQTGQAVARRAKAFGMRVLGTRARPAATECVDEVHAADRIAQLMPRADFVAVATPLLPSTRGLIGKTAISVMKKGAVLADVSRGGVVDHTALRDALISGQLGGAALDVFEQEPLPPESPLWDTPNVLISPHCSSVHAEWERASFGLFLKNLDRYLNDQPLFNVVDPGRGY